MNQVANIFYGNAIMSSRSRRVGDGIDRLVRRLLVDIPGEDPVAADEREQNAIDFVREVLGRYGVSKIHIATCPPG